jgi:hypothetical protein
MSNPIKDQTKGETKALGHRLGAKRKTEVVVVLAFRTTKSGGDNPHEDRRHQVRADLVIEQNNHEAGSDLALLGE